MDPEHKRRQKERRSHQTLCSLSLLTLLRFSTHLFALISILSDGSPLDHRSPVLYSLIKVHPSLPVVSDHLAFLPATLLTLTVVLSPEDREVLSYLIPCTGNSSEIRRNDQKQKSVAVSESGGDHPPSFNCNCFRCYMSYWVRWDSSPNRQLIHEILDGFEDQLLQQGANSKSKRERRRRGGHGGNNDEKRFGESSVVRHEMDELESVEMSGDGEGETCGGGGGCGGEEEGEKGSMRRFVSFIGERIWGVWGP